MYLPRLSHQPPGYAKNDSASQDQHRYGANDATIEATAREMTSHWFNSNTFSLIVSYDDGSTAGQAGPVSVLATRLHTQFRNS
jgi:hypothetical protein